MFSWIRRFFKSKEVDSQNVTDQVLHDLLRQAVSYILSKQEFANSDVGSQYDLIDARSAIIREAIKLYRGQFKRGQLTKLAKFANRYAEMVIRGRQI